MNFENHKTSNEFTLNGVWLNPKERICRVFGKEIELNNEECIILELFMKNPDIFFTREQIIDTIDKIDLMDRAVDSIIRCLRKKLFPNNETARHLFIETKYGVGYRIPNLRNDPDRNS